MNKSGFWVIFKDRMLVKKLVKLVLITLFCFLLQALIEIFLHHLPIAMRLFGILFIALLNIGAVLFGYLDNLPMFRLTLTTILFVAFFVLGFLILDLTGFFEKFTSFDSLKNFILSTGRWGKLIYVLLIILQIVVLPIPSMLLEVVASNLFGATTAFILSATGVLIGSMICYLIGKYLGKKVVIWIAGKENTEKYTKVFKERGKYFFIVMMLFPFFPDDIICMVAGLSGMSFGYFSLIVVLTRPVSSAVNCFLGSGDIIPFRSWGIPIWIILFISIGATFYLVMQYTHKKEERQRLKKKLLNRESEHESEDLPKLITNPSIVNNKQLFDKLSSKNEKEP